MFSQRMLLDLTSEAELSGTSAHGRNQRATPSRIVRRRATRVPSNGDSRGLFQKPNRSVHPDRCREGKLCPHLGGGVRPTALVLPRAANRKTIDGRPIRNLGAHSKVFQPSQIQDSTQTSTKAYLVSRNASIILEVALDTALSRPGTGKQHGSEVAH
jgi:hypothetical protein